jgi:uncharacterized membrane protein
MNKELKFIKEFILNLMRLALTAVFFYGIYWLFMLTIVGLYMYPLYVSIGLAIVVGAFIITIAEGHQ